MTAKKYGIQLSSKEHAQVLAALRFYAASLFESPNRAKDVECVATDMGKYKAPESDEVDALANTLADYSRVSFHSKVLS